MGILDGKAAVVTGGAGLLGSEFAKALAKEGARVLLNDVNEQDARRVVSEIEAAGGDATVNFDPVDSWKSAGRIIESCLDTFGRIDCLITSAHRTAGEPIWNLNEADLDLSFGTHVKGHFACVHHASKAMMRQGSGSIITIGSRALNGLPGLSTYASVKGAIMSATFSWALELADYGVRVNCINPAAMKSNETVRHMRWHWDFTVDKKGWSEPVPSPDTVAPLAVYLASDSSSWITGQVIFLSGDTLALLRHPREERFGFKPDGWTVGDLELYFRDTVGASLEMPGMDVPRYRWYGGVET